MRLPLNLRGDFLAEFWRYRIGFHESEVFEIAHFDSGMRLLASGVSRHSVGSADRAAVFSKEIIREALKRNAYAIAFAHNHPSGDPKPSDADLLITKQLVLASNASQIRPSSRLTLTPMLAAVGLISPLSKHASNSSFPWKKKTWLLMIALMLAPILSSSPLAIDDSWLAPRIPCGSIDQSSYAVEISAHSNLLMESRLVTIVGQHQHPVRFTPSKETPM